MDTRPTPKPPTFDNIRHNQHVARSDQLYETMTNKLVAAFRSWVRKKNFNLTEGASYLAAVSSIPESVVALIATPARANASNLTLHQYLQLIRCMNLDLHVEIINLDDKKSSQARLTSSASD